MDKLIGAIDSLRRQSYPQESFELVIVDDGSTDGTLNWLEKNSREDSWLSYYSQDHSGPAVARNLAAGKARGEILLFMGDDIIASDDLIRKHIRAFDKMGGRTAVQGGVKLAPGVNRTRFVRYLDERSAAQFQLNHAKRGDSLHFSMLYTCNCSFPKRLLLDCGGFPTDVIYYDDTFLGWKLAQKSIPIIYEPEAEVFHDHAQTLDEFLARQKQAGKDAAVLAAKHPELRASLRVDQTTVFEGHPFSIAKKAVKKVIFNRLSTPIMKKIASCSLLPFSWASFIYSGLIGYEHRKSAGAALAQNRRR
ncbi:MAG: glycosyltransferase [Candidatus Coatesbacteria bacterium]|nr:glycosyltransferase [Candidatus Coatesbacteria bacterium]